MVHLAESANVLRRLRSDAGLPSCFEYIKNTAQQYFTEADALLRKGIRFIFGARFAPLGIVPYYEPDRYRSLFTFTSRVLFSMLEYHESGYLKVI